MIVAPCVSVVPGGMSRIPVRLIDYISRTITLMTGKIVRLGSEFTGAMSRPTDSVRGEAAARSRDAPAVGIVATPEHPEAVAAAVLRAHRHGLDALVYANGHPDCEAVELAGIAGARIVDGRETGDGIDPRAHLRRAARREGYAGLIYGGDPSDRPDVGRSLELLKESDEYLIEAEPTPEVGLVEKDSPSETAPGRLEDQHHASHRSPSQDHSVLAIVPAYNEENSIRDVLVETKPYVDRVIVIDDASTDRTASVAKQVADGVISLPRNMGVGAAVHTGYLAGIREGYDVIVQIDGDGQHDPSYIPQLIRTLEEEEADIVVGSRWLNASFREYSWLRRMGIKFFTFEANMIGGLDITDVTSGYRAYRVEMLSDLGRPENSHWALEQTLEAARKGYTIEEVSVPMPPAPNGSQFDLSTLLKYPPRMLFITLKVILFR